MELIIYPDKKIYRRSAQQYINLGDYTEAMRWYFSLDKVYEPFLQTSKDDLRLNELKDGYLLEIENGEHKRKLFVDKRSFLPKHNNYIVTDAGTGFEQVQDVYFYFNENSRTIPDSVLNSDYYIARDYEVIVQERLAEELNADKRDFSTEDLELLLSYPFVTAQGDTASIIDIKQSYILLDFWFASCLPCMHGMPRVNTLMEKYAGQGLQIRGINCHDMERRNSLVQKLEQRNISVPHFFGSRDLLNTLDISSFPTYMLIFPDRRIEIFEGGIAQVEQALKGIFDK